MPQKQKENWSPHLKPSKNSQFQIIGGTYRSRRFDFVDAPALRPTPNKIRETLFNWIQFELANKSVLDLFSGSGALGFEALSRGASQVVCVEKNLHAYQCIKNNALALNTKKLALHHQDAFDFIQNNTQPFDFVLLDPPFHERFLEKSLALIQNSPLKNSKIYLESEFEFNEENCKIPCKILKKQHSASVFYCLIQLTNLSQ
jgi:16S rRNA (guanine966-N2)-methyltransferase